MRKKCECLPLPLTCHSKYDEAGPPRHSEDQLLQRNHGSPDSAEATGAPRPSSERRRSVLMPPVVNTQLNTQRKYVLADLDSRGGRHASRSSGGPPITAPPEDTSLSVWPIIMCKIVELTNKIVKQVCHCPIIKKVPGLPRPNESAI